MVERIDIVLVPVRSTYRPELIYKDYKVTTNELLTIVEKRLSSKQVLLEIILKFGRLDYPILEVGCGSAIVSSKASLFNREIVGVDVSKNALSVANRIRRCMHSPLHLILCDGRRLPFREQTFGLVFSEGVVHLFKDHDILLREQKRVLRENGYLLVDVPNIFTLYTIVKHIKILLGLWPWGWESQYSCQKLIKALEKLGFRFVSYYSRDIDPYVPPKFTRIMLSKCNCLKVVFSLNIGVIAKKA